MLAAVATQQSAPQEDDGFVVVRRRRNRNSRIPQGFVDQNSDRARSARPSTRRPAIAPDLYPRRRANLFPLGLRNTTASYADQFPPLRRPLPPPPRRQHVAASMVNMVRLHEVTDNDDAGWDDSLEAPPLPPDVEAALDAGSVSQLLKAVANAPPDAFVPRTLSSVTTHVSEFVEPDEVRSTADQEVPVTRSADHEPPRFPSGFEGAIFAVESDEPSVKGETAEQRQARITRNAHRADQRNQE